MFNVPVYSVLLTLVPTACVHQLGFLHHSTAHMVGLSWSWYSTDQSTCQFPMLVSHTLTSEPTAYHPLVLVCVSHSLHFPFFWVSTSSMQDCRDNLSLLHWQGGWMWIYSQGPMGSQLHKTYCQAISHMLLPVLGVAKTTPFMLWIQTSYELSSSI